MVVSCRLLRNTPSGSNSGASGGGSGVSGSGGGGSGVADVSGGVEEGEGVESSSNEPTVNPSTTTPPTTTTTPSSSSSHVPSSNSSSSSSNNSGSGSVGLSELEVWTIFDGAHEALALRPASQLPGSLHDVMELLLID